MRKSNIESVRFSAWLVLGFLASVSSAWAQQAPLSLLDAQRLAFANHGDVAAARLSLAGAAQRITSAKSGRAPQLSGTIGSDYQNGRLLSAPIIQNGVNSTFTTGVAVTQNIFDSGRTSVAVRQARAGAGAQLGGLGTARNSLASEVSTRFSSNCARRDWWRSARISLKSRAHNSTKSRPALMWAMRRART